MKKEELSKKERYIKVLKSLGLWLIVVGVLLFIFGLINQFLLSDENGFFIYAVGLILFVVGFMLRIGIKKII